MRVKRVYWDLDGTLWRNKENEVELIAKTAKMPYSWELEKQFYQMLDDLEEHFQHQVVTVEKVEDYIESKMLELERLGITGKDFLKAWDETPTRVLISGAREILQYSYEKEIKNFAVTNWHRYAQELTLRELDLLQYMKEVYTWDDSYPKSHPERIKTIVSGEEGGIMVGNNWTDIAFAKKARLTSVLLDETGKKSWKDYEPDIRIKSLKDLIPML